MTEFALVSLAEIFTGLARPEQSLHALDSMDCGIAVGRTPEALNESSPQASTSGVRKYPSVGIRNGSEGDAIHHTDASSNQGAVLPVTPEEDEAWNKMGALE